MVTVHLKSVEIGALTVMVHLKSGDLSSNGDFNGHVCGVDV